MTSRTVAGTSGLAVVAMLACGGGRSGSDGGHIEVSSDLDAASDRIDGSDTAVEAGVDGPGTDASLNCVPSWPTAAAVAPAAALAVQPRVLWSMPLPTNDPVADPIVVTGTGVALSSGYRLIIADGAGSIVASVTNPQMDFTTLSAPVAGPDGSIYFANASSAFRVDGAGRIVWQKPLGARLNSGNEFAGPAPPLYDPGGKVHISALDGHLWTFRADNGDVISNWPISSQDAPRPFVMGVGETLFAYRYPPLPAGVRGSALGAFSPATGEWQGELLLSAGPYQPSAIGGAGIGIVLYGWLNTDAETTEVDVLDHCGKLRWRVPGNYAYPVAITFDDDLIVRDKVPAGGGAYTYTLRRFSRDGVLKAGPTTTRSSPGVLALVGADDTLYLNACDQGGQTVLLAFDRTLAPLWSLPVASANCLSAAVLNAEGKLFGALVEQASTLVAIQTTSPGPARTGWSRARARDERGTSWLAP